ncbi:MAG: cell division protein FtsL [Burkholderiales bacterium]|nr:cell division protein FtsL [Burkholderiales bacterium]
MSLRLTLIMLAALMACAMATVAAQHKARKLFVELQREQGRAKQLEIEWGQLQLEQGTWATHARIERIASRELSMKLPVAARIEVIPPLGEGAKP